MHHFTKPIHESHHRTVPPLCQRQGRNQVHGNTVPRTLRHRQRLQQSHRLLRRNLCRLTHLTTLNHCPHRSTHPRPIIPCRQTPHNTICPKVASQGRLVVSQNQLLLQFPSRHYKCPTLPPSFTQDPVVPNILRAPTGGLSFRTEKPIVRTRSLRSTHIIKSSVSNGSNQGVELKIRTPGQTVNMVGGTTNVLNGKCKVPKKLKPTRLTLG